MAFFYLWCRQKYSYVWFSIAFLRSILEPSTENIKKKFGQNCFENEVSDLKKQNNWAINVRKKEKRKKEKNLSYDKLSLKKSFCSKYIYCTTKIFSSKIIDKIFKAVFSQFFFNVFVLGSIIFTIFLGIQKYVWKDLYHTVSLAL